MENEKKEGIGVMKNGMKQKINLKILMALILIFSCSKKEGEIKSEGGILETDLKGEIRFGSLEIKVTEGAIDENVRIKIQEVTDVPKGNIGKAYRITPDIIFKKPVEISIEGREGNVLAYVDKDKWSPIPSWSEGGRVRARTLHLSTWSLVSDYPSHITPELPNSEPSMDVSPPIRRTLIPKSESSIGGSPLKRRTLAYFEGVQVYSVHTDSKGNTYLVLGDHWFLWPGGSWRLYKVDIFGSVKILISKENELSVPWIVDVDEEGFIYLVYFTKEREEKFLRVNTQSGETEEVFDFKKMSETLKVDWFTIEVYRHGYFWGRYKRGGEEGIIKFDISCRADFIPVLGSISQSQVITVDREGRIYLFLGHRQCIPERCPPPFRIYRVKDGLVEDSGLTIGDLFKPGDGGWWWSLTGDADGNIYYAGGKRLGMIRPDWRVETIGHIDYPFPGAYYRQTITTIDWSQGAVVVPVYDIARDVMREFGREQRTSREWSVIVQ